MWYRFIKPSSTQAITCLEDFLRVQMHVSHILSTFQLKLNQLQIDIHVYNQVRFEVKYYSTVIQVINIVCIYLPTCVYPTFYFVYYGLEVKLELYSLIFLSSYINISIFLLCTVCTMYGLHCNRDLLYSPFIIIIVINRRVIFHGRALILCELPRCATYYWYLRYSIIIYLSTCRDNIDLHNRYLLGKCIHSPHLRIIY